MLRLGHPVVLLLVLSSANCAPDANSIRMATTTSVDASGLLQAILPPFQEETRIRVDVIAVGSGRAIALARRGDADLALTHDPDLERAFVSEGRAELYRKLMFNDFLIVGSAGDPARVREASDARDAMRRIAQARAWFASRGDQSGTDAREKRLWQLAGARPGQDRLLETGQGMAATLRVASERGAYCLTDRATFVQLANRLSLSPCFEGGSDLLNTYAVIVVKNRAGVTRTAALRLALWLSDGRGRDVIGAFRVKGRPVFSVWPAGVPRDSPDALPREQP
jgi:tungstate transport system substrate-binding protein